MDEAQYRSLMKRTLDRVECALENVDPDIADCSVQFGALTIVFSDGSKCILSAQPSVRQLWMAMASKGVALHFNWDPAREAWLDDKTGKIELLDHLSGFLKEATGQDIRIA